MGSARRSHIKMKKKIYVTDKKLLSDEPDSFFGCTSTSRCMAGSQMNTPPSGEGHEIHGYVAKHQIQTDFGDVKGYRENADNIVLNQVAR